MGKRYGKDEPLSLSEILDPANEPEVSKDVVLALAGDLMRQHGHENDAVTEAYARGVTDERKRVVALLASLRDEWQSEFDDPLTWATFDPEPRAEALGVKRCADELTATLNKL